MSTRSAHPTAGRRRKPSRNSTMQGLAYLLSFGCGYGAGRSPLDLRSRSSIRIALLHAPVRDTMHHVQGRESQPSRREIVLTGCHAAVRDRVLLMRRFPRWHNRDWPMVPLCTPGPGAWFLRLPPPSLCKSDNRRTIKPCRHPICVPADRIENQGP